MRSQRASSWVSVRFRAPRESRSIYDHHDPKLAANVVERLGGDLQNESCPQTPQKSEEPIIEKDHREVEALFAKFESTHDAAIATVMAAMSFPSAEVAAAMERHGAVPRFTVYIEK